MDSKLDAGTSQLKLGKMHLVDLAGNERVNALTNTGGASLVETQQINLSLTAIGM